MKRSSVTAVLRIYDTGQEHLAAYYLDLFAEQHFIDVWHRDHFAEDAQQFVEDWGFDGYALAITRLDSVAKQ